jgi:hypothetical protein
MENGKWTYRLACCSSAPDSKLCSSGVAVICAEYFSIYHQPLLPAFDVAKNNKGQTLCNLVRT